MKDSLSSTQQIVSAQLLETYQQLKQRLLLPESRLTLAMEYALLSGGKRLRPLLHRLVANTLQTNEQDAKICELALEAIHAYSLVHDDLPAMDDDELRRGQPTTHVKFDEATAILAGDSLQTLAFECLALMPLSEQVSHRRCELIAILATAAGSRGMCLGQSLDLGATNKKIDADALIRLHQLKTGALLKASVEMGTVLSPEISAEAKLHLTNFAEALGLAFQIQDDILDVTSDTKTLGKPQGSDQSLNKSTFVTFYGVEGAKKELQKKYDVAMRSLQHLEYNTDLLAAFADLIVSRTF